VPTIGGTAAGDVTEDVNVVAGNLATAGALTIADTDQNQSSFITQASHAGTYGTFTLAANGAWTYAAIDSLPAIEQLNTGQSLIDSFTAVSFDGTSSQQVSVTIHGTSDSMAANGERLVLSQGSTWDNSFASDLLANDSSPNGGLHFATTALFDSSHQASSIAYVHNADGSAATGYTVTEDASGNLTLAIAKNVVAGGNLGAADVFFDYTVTDTVGNTATATADIKAINVTPGANAVNLSAAGVGSYNFSYLDGTKGADAFTGTAANDTFVGAGGGDSLTGGGGFNTYKYNATSDSTPGSGHFDTITDFVHGTDKIDFTGITGLTQVVGATSIPLTIAANTIELVATGGNTTIYANASAVAESTTSADMEVHLVGVTNMTFSDILHH